MPAAAIKAAGRKAVARRLTGRRYLGGRLLGSSALVLTGLWGSGGPDRALAGAPCDMRAPSDVAELPGARQFVPPFMTGPVPRRRSMPAPRAGIASGPSVRACRGIKGAFGTNLPYGAWVRCRAIGSAVGCPLHPLGGADCLLDLIFLVTGQHADAVEPSSS